MDWMYLDVHNNVQWSWSACKVWHKKTQKAETVVLYMSYKSESEEMFNNESETEREKYATQIKKMFKKQIVKQFVRLRLLRGQCVPRVL